MRVGSLFAGVGGFDLGLERCGMETVWQCEIDKQCRSVLKRHWPDVECWDDVRTSILGKGLPPVDLLCGGFPCQDYSVAGKRGGLAGDRGALWWEFHRIIAECRPVWVVGENVPGLLSSNGGADFLTIVGSLVQLGYGVTWAVLDSKYFGVAQRRRRLFIVGHSGGIARPEVLALSEGMFGHPAPSREAGQEVAGSIGSGSTASKRGRRNDLDNHGAYPLACPDPAYALSAGKDGKGAGRTFGTGRDAQDTFIVSPVPRRLTPRECERLQGLPDDWTRWGHDGKELADGPRYRMMGNAVTVPVIEWIGRRIMAAQCEDVPQEQPQEATCTI